MRPREFIALIGGAAVAWPLAVRAQLWATDAENPGTRHVRAALMQGLSDLRWLQGRNLRIEERFATDDDQRRMFAKELVSLQPDLIFAASTPSLAAVLQATSTIPVIFAGVSDPVVQGFVSNLAHPGRNVTGFTLFEFSMAGKWLGMLQEIAPRTKRVAVIYHPDIAPSGPLYMRAIESVAKAFAIELVSAPVRDEAELEHAIVSVGREPNGALIVPPDIFTGSHYKQIIELADQYRLPAMYTVRRPFMMEGGLIYYGTDNADMYRRAASYVDRVLRGEKPSDLPVQAPTKFELVINLKTARALGLDVPLHLQQLADEVIE